MTFWTIFHDIFLTKLVFSKSFTQGNIYFTCVQSTASIYYIFSPHDVDKIFSY